jgi:ABC-type Fe3+ transport system permease subunit
MNVVILLLVALLGCLALVVLQRGLNSGAFASRGAIVRRSEKPGLFWAIAGLYIFALCFLIYAAVTALASLMRG